MEDFSLHILDIAENAITAGATLVEISILEDKERDILQISIIDNGCGMEPEMLEKAFDPFVTSRTTRRVGLGIPLLYQATREADGNLIIKSEIDRGTEIKATFKNSHIDLKPIGDIASTIISLILSNPDIDYRYESNINGKKTVFDTREIKAELDGVRITEPDVLQLIRDLF